MAMTRWKCALELDEKRRIVSGDDDGLVSAVRRAADLRIYTTFIHNEHIDVTSKTPEPVEEVSAFQVTYLVEGRWCAGIMMLRQPVDLPMGFGPRASLSCFMYNQDGRQAIARVFLDGRTPDGAIGPAPLDDRSDMPKYHQSDNWDAGTNAPSHNFVYDFGSFRFCVSDTWREIYAHGPDGRVSTGSFDALVKAFKKGCEIKVAIAGACADLAEAPGPVPMHELFVQTGWNYHYTGRRLFLAETLPAVRVAPAVPMQYRSRNWDVAWYVVKTDGVCEILSYDPYTLRQRKIPARFGVRWFIR